MFKFKSMLMALALTLMSHAVLAQAPARNVVTTESTITATVDRIEKSSRVVTLRSEGNILRSVYVEPSVKAFDDLKTGDVIKVRYAESVVVQVRPGAALSDLTTETLKAGNDQVIEQLKAVVTIERIDPQGLSIEYRTKDGLKALRHVNNKRLLEGLHEGDRIEITLTRERALSIERVPR